MNPASVGFQCPSCVREGARSVRTPRTVLGGRLPTRVGRVTGTIIALNVAVFLVGLAHPLDLRFGNLASAIQTGDGSLYRGVAGGEYYRLITSAFLHAGILHLLFNMYALAQVGPPLERALGSARFVGLYVLSALGGSTLSYLVSAPNVVGVGASGAIFGLFGAYYIVVRRLGGETGPIVMLLVLNLVITFSVPVIDWRAHIGGLVTGAAVAAAYVYLPGAGRGRDRAYRDAAATAAVLVLLAVGVWLRTRQLTG